MAVIKIVKNTAGLLAAGIVAGTLLLTLVFMIPVNEAHPNAAASVSILEKEGWYPIFPLVDSFKEIGGPVINSMGILDNFTDSIMIHTAVDSTEGSALYRALNSYNSVMDTGYSYYWHGYVTILRPLLLFIDYGEIRVLNSMLQILLSAMLAGMIYKKKGLPWFLLSLTVYGLLMPMALMFSLQYSWVFYIGTLGSMTAVKYGDYLWAKNRLIYFFMILGMLSSYMDLLTYPLFTWGMPMLWLIVTCGEELTEEERVRSVISCGIFWIIGYGGMWAGKWLMGQLVLPDNVLSRALREVKYRAGMYENTAGSGQSRLMPVVHNYRRFDNIQSFAIFSAWSVWLGARLYRNKGVIRPDKCYSLGLIALSSFVWYMVLKNHTYEHTGFTFRILVISIAAILAIMIIAVEKEAVSVRRDRNKILTAAAILGISVLLAFLDRVSLHVHNGYCESERILLEEGDVLEQVLVPAFANIESMHLGLIAEGDGDGEYLIEIVEGDQVFFQACLTAAEVADSGFYEIPADIKLKKEKEYLLRMAVRGEDVRMWVTVTMNGEKPVQEMSYLSLNGEELNGQVISAIYYRKLPDKIRIFMNIFAWAGILGSICLVYFYTLQNKKVFINNRKQVRGAFRG